MAADKVFTLKGALALLGHREHQLLARLDRALGGVILASAPFSGVLFGLVDQKNEAIGLLRALVTKVGELVDGTAGQERHRLITAAHTVIVGTAFFESVAEVVGERRFRALDLLTWEKADLVADEAGAARRGLADALYGSAVPCPSAAAGFEDTAQTLESVYYDGLAGRLNVFVKGLAAGQYVELMGLRSRLSGKAALRYREHYRAAMAQVPEFRIWSELTEHAATQHRLDGQSRALARMEARLREITRALPPGGTSLSSRLHQLNLAAAARSVLADEAQDELPGVTIPSGEDIYVTPAFKLAVADPDSRLSSEAWWWQRSRVEDLDTFLTAHFVALESTQRPLVLLGHPGAGKSLFTKMLAARLPAEHYTVVRVELRRVDESAPVHTQIQQALDRSSNHRLDWGRLTDERPETIRVVLLDGFDELLQASKHDRSGYLQEIAEYQRVEADNGCPVAVVVTSRTLVVERMRVPAACLVVKLEEFDEPRVEDWLGRWRRANPGSPQASLEAAVAQYPDLAKQPLLLLMLVLDAFGERAGEPGAQDRSGAALYGQILRNFIWRDLRKRLAPGVDPSPRAIDERLWHLGIAAYAMFNRGRQYAADQELARDFAAFEQDERAHVETVGRFFFIHTAGADLHRGEEARRSYEFLHATFGEYLVAYQCVEALKDIHRRQGSDGRVYPGDDDRLFALLSHQPFTTRPTILAFTEDLLRDTQVQPVVEQLLRQARSRPTKDAYAAYRPTPRDTVRELACYTANLTMLLLRASARIDLRRLSGAGDQTHVWWRAMVNLWRAGLEFEPWASVLSAVELTGGCLTPAKGAPEGFRDKAIMEAELEQDPRRARWVSAGSVTWDSAQGRRDLHAELLSVLLGGSHDVFRLIVLLRDMEKVSRPTLRLLWAILPAVAARTQADATTELMAEVLRVIRGSDVLIPADVTHFVVSACPELLDELPELRRRTGQWRNVALVEAIRRTWPDQRKDAVSGVWGPEDKQVPTRVYTTDTVEYLLRFILSTQQEDG